MRYNRLCSSEENVKLWTQDAFGSSFNKREEKHFRTSLKVVFNSSVWRGSPGASESLEQQRRKHFKLLLFAAESLLSVNCLSEQKSWAQEKIQQQRQAHENVFYSAGEIIKVLTTLFDSLDSVLEVVEEKNSKLLEYLEIISKNDNSTWAWAWVH